MKINEAAAEFLACRRIAVTGVSRMPGSHGANVVYDRLLERGFEAIAINPNADEIAGRPAYPDLRSVPDGVEGVVLGSAPLGALVARRVGVVGGIGRVWMHRSIDGGSVDDEAVAYGREHGVVVIDGGCPLMFGPAADGAHKAMCAVLKLMGRVPRTVR